VEGEVKDKVGRKKSFSRSIWPVALSLTVFARLFDRNYREVGCASAIAQLLTENEQNRFSPESLLISLGERISKRLHVLTNLTTILSISGVPDEEDDQFGASREMIFAKISLKISTNRTFRNLWVSIRTHLHT